MTGFATGVPRPVKPPRRASGADRRRTRLSWLLSTGTVWLICGLCGYFFWFYLNAGVHGLDSRAYWLTGHRSGLYVGPPGSHDAYLYSPAFATVIWPLTQLPWHAFLTLWMLAEAAAFVWLLAPLGWRWGIPMLCLCLIEITVGNIYSFLAVAAVIGMRHPAAWALPLLTKITPGLGPIWFAARREWRALAQSLGTTAAIAAVSFAVAPHLWVEWARFLLANTGSSQWFLPLRVCGAVVLTVVAAAKRRSWLLAPAMLLANPVVVHGWMALSLLAAIPRLRAGYEDRGDAQGFGAVPTTVARASR
jgi:Glycosyltransferase family 87